MNVLDKKIEINKVIEAGADGIEPSQLFKVDLRLANGYLNHSVILPKEQDS